MYSEINWELVLYRLESNFDKGREKLQELL